jgi:hypothetical protein
VKALSPSPYIVIFNLCKRKMNASRFNTEKQSITYADPNLAGPLREPDIQQELAAPLLPAAEAVNETTPRPRRSYSASRHATLALAG